MQKSRYKLYALLVRHILYRPEPAPRPSIERVIGMPMDRNCLWYSRASSSCELERFACRADTHPDTLKPSWTGLMQTIQNECRLTKSQTSMTLYTAPSIMKPLWHRDAVKQFHFGLPHPYSNETLIPMIHLNITKLAKFLKFNFKSVKRRYFDDYWSRMTIDVTSNISRIALPTAIVQQIMLQWRWQRGVQSHNDLQRFPPKWLLHADIAQSNNDLVAIQQSHEYSAFCERRLLILRVGS